jgi:hypothetical protein
VPWVPEGRDDELIVKGDTVIGAGAMGSDTVVVAVCTEEPESVTLMAKE